MKKLFCTILILVLILSLASCSNANKDPLELSKKLGEDYYVEIYVDEEDIDEFAEDLETKKNGIYCIIETYPDNDNDEDEWGIFVFCEDKKTASEIQEDLQDILEDELEEEVRRGVVEKISKTVIFIGCEDILDELK